MNEKKSDLLHIRSSNAHGMNKSIAKVATDRLNDD